MIYLVELATDRGLFDPGPLPLVNALTSLPTTAYTQVAGNVWLIVTGTETAAQLYNRLQPHILTKDRLFIISIDPNAQFFGWLPQNVWDWLNQAMLAERVRGALH